MSRLNSIVIRGSGRWIIYTLCAIACWFVVGIADAAQEGPVKRVLIISTGSRFSPGFALIEQSALDTMAKLSPGRIDFYSEYLDIIRFPSESYQRIFRNYLRDKYADNSPDLLMLFYVGNLGIAATLLQQLFPEVPVVVAGFTEEKFATDRLGSLVSGFAQHVNPRATMELILRLQPETRRIVIIGGTAEVDRPVLDRAENEARSFAGRVEFDLWNKRPLAEIRKSVISLPARTVLLFTGMYRDAAGETFIPARVARLIAESAKVPLYVLSDAQVGVGSVGGFVVDVGMMGKRAGELANRILGGAAPASLLFESRSDGVPMFDWRALQRWGIPESRLPSGSVVRNKPMSIWAQYRWYMIGAATLVALQALMITGLLLQRARRRLAEDELSESRQFMELATAAGGIGLWVRDLARGELWGNPRLRSLLGFAPHDVPTVDQVVARINPDDRAPTISVIERAQEAGEPFEVEFRTAITGMPERWIVARGEFVRGSKGQVLRRMGTMIDITERKRVEIELQRNREELAHVSRVATVGELTTSIAHELNQPLGAILSNAEAAEIFLSAEPPALDEVRDILADIRKDDQRASEVIRRMRRLLRKQELAPKSIDINEAVDDALKLLNIDASVRKVALKIERAADLPRVWCDPVHFQQVLLNLVLNGMDAMAGLPEEKRRLVVCTEHGDNGMVQIAVADCGPGIPVDKLPHLFEPFFTTKTDGMGVGLSIARTIVEAHQGKIWAENNAAAGATFCFTVPVDGGK